ncbi:MAG TPA: hypothetical protein VID75_01070 [Acidimicrobiales bacterium]
MAPAIGGPAGSRYGPSGTPSPNASSPTPAPAIGGPAGSRYGPSGTPATS